MAVQRRCRALAVLAALVAALLPTAGAPPARAETTPDVTSVPVAFQVANTNTSGVPCFSDGAAYTVSGHLTGPPSAFEAGAASAVTIYLFGEDAGEWNWHLTGLPAYDH